MHLRVETVRDYNAMIELKDIYKRYDSPTGGGAVEVLKGITLSVGRGDSIAIVGPSGSGKSTLLNIIGALDTADSGSVSVAGRDLGGLDEKALAGLRSELVGFVFQLHHLLPQLTILENVLVPTLVRRAGHDREEIEARAASLLRRVGLADRSGHRPGQLSGGQRQRVAVARALINQPHVLLADEPTGSLDGRTAESVVELLAELNKTDGLTLVMVTHSTKLAERAGRVLELADGILK